MRKRDQDSHKAKLYSLPHHSGKWRCFNNDSADTWAKGCSITLDKYFKFAWNMSTLSLCHVAMDEKRYKRHDLVMVKILKATRDNLPETATVMASTHFHLILLQLAYVQTDIALEG